MVALQDVEGVEIYNYPYAPPDLLWYMRRVSPRAPGEIYFCSLVFVWRKPYNELSARRANERLTKRRIAFWLGVAGGLFLIERAVW